jgi:hypothetical protein
VDIESPSPHVCEVICRDREGGWIQAGAHGG